MAGYRAGKGGQVFHEADQRERQRVAAIIAAEQEHRAAELVAVNSGERRNSRASDAVDARRAWQANGRPHEEATDTIGKLWAWGLLDNARYDSDLLRDAGRRYAAAYWFRYGNVCPSVAAYAEMTRVPTTVPRTVIADEAKDEIAEARFLLRDDTLREGMVGGRTKRLVDQVCVDGQGDNDPLWLIDMMNGYVAETRNLRMAVSSIRAEIVSSSKPDRNAQRRLDYAERKLREAEQRLRRDRLPYADLALIRDGLSALADIDRAEGLHKPRRGTVVSGAENEPENRC